MGALIRCQFLTIVLLVALALAPPASADEPDVEVAGASAPPAGRSGFYWDDGVRYRLAWSTLHADWGGGAHPDLLDGQIGVRLQVDAAAYIPSAGLHDVSDGIEVRRFYLTTRGEIGLRLPIQYKLELGVDKNRFYIDSFFLRLTDVPVAGTFTIGLFRAPMSLDDRTSSDARTFMESAAPIEAFAPGNKAGVQVSDYSADERMTWAFGWFTNAQRNDVGDSTRSLTRVVGRVTWLARVDDAAPVPSFVHLGVSASYVSSNGEAVQYESRPESFLAPKLVNTGDLDAQHAFPMGVEFAAVRGPLSMQGEYLGSVVNAPSLGNPLFRGGYGFLSYLLSGESRPYDRRRGVFVQLDPAHPVTLSHWAAGAWEVAARWSYLDLSEGSVNGGRMGIAMGDLTWYWNRHVRWLFEYGFARVRGGSTPGDLHIFQARFQLTI